MERHSTGQNRISRRTYLQSTSTAAGLGVLTGLAGCTRLGGSQWKRRITIATPQTGPLGAFGGAIIQGGRVAIDEVNSNSDQDDIEITTADTAAEVEQARSVIQDAIEEGAVAITGTVSSDVTTSTRELLEQEEVPQVTPIAGNPEITQEGTRFSFRIPGDEEQKEWGTLQFLSENDVTDVAIIATDFSYPRQTVNYFRQHMEAFDINLEHVSFTPFGTDNFRPELAKFSDDDVQALFLPVPGAGGVNLIQQIREEGFFDNNIVIGDYSYGSVPYFQALGEGLLGVNNWGADLTSSRSQQLISEMQSRFNNRIAIYHLLGYDAARVVGDGINAADSLDPVAVRDAISETDYDAASGWRVTFDDSGHCATYQMIVNQWERQGGDLVNARRFGSDVIPASPSQ